MAVEIMQPAPKSRSVLKNIRLCGALLLVVTLCLPMSRCTTYVDSKGQPQFFPDKSKDTEKTIYYYLLSGAYQSLVGPPNVGSPYFIVPAFVWPLGVILLSRRPKLKRWFRIAFWLQCIAISYAGFITFIVSYVLTQPLIGAGTGTAGVALSAIAWLTDAFLLLRARFTRNRSRAA